MTWLAAYPTITVILASFKPLGLMLRQLLERLAAGREALGTLPT